MLSKASYLNHEGLVSEAWSHTQLTHVRSFVDKIFDAMEDSASGGRDPAMNATLANGLPGDTSISIDVLLGGEGGGTEGQYH